MADTEGSNGQVQTWAVNIRGILSPSIAQELAAKLAPGMPGSITLEVTNEQTGEVL